MNFETGRSITQDSRTCAVTGASGYVGGVIASALSVAGWNVIHMGRTPPRTAEKIAPHYLPFSLGDSPPVGSLRNVNAIVHCAYDFAPLDRETIWRSNVDGSIRLFEAAQRDGVQRIVFISSMSAFEGCKSLYGQAKLAVEKQSAPLGALIVRPGLVYGSQARGMVGALANLASLPLFTPMVGTGHMVLYLAHESDLGCLIVRGLELDAKIPATPIIAANDSPRTLRQIVQSLSASQGKGKKLFIPIPPMFLWTLLRTMEAAGFRPRTRSDSLVSLLNQDPHPQFGPTHQLGISFRAF